MHKTFYKILCSFCMGELFAFCFKQHEHQILLFGCMQEVLGEHIPKARLNLLVLGEEGDVGDSLSFGIKWLSTIEIFGGSE